MTFLTEHKRRFLPKRGPGRVDNLSSQAQMPLPVQSLLFPSQSPLPPAQSLRSEIDSASRQMPFKVTPWFTPTFLQLLSTISNPKKASPLPLTETLTVPFCAGNEKSSFYPDGLWGVGFILLENHGLCPSTSWYSTWISRLWTPSPGISQAVSSLPKSENSTFPPTSSSQPISTGTLLSETRAQVHANVFCISQLHPQLFSSTLSYCLHFLSKKKSSSSSWRQTLGHTLDPSPHVLLLLPYEAYASASSIR